jgi:hypothetical protein
MDEKLFFLILIIFLLSSNFSKLFQDISKNFIYFMLIIIILGIVSPSIQENVKINLINIINLDSSVFKTSISYIFKKIKLFIYSTFQIESMPNSQEPISSV